MVKHTMSYRNMNRYVTFLPIDLCGTVCLIYGKYIIHVPYKFISLCACCTQRSLCQEHNCLFKVCGAECVVGGVCCTHPSHPSGSIMASLV